jgi:PTH1 family peptidyl-tRNA hydrolase
MNDSGSFVKQLVDKYKLDLGNLYIIHDDLDILLGEYKIQFGRGPQDHNGLKSINQSLKSDQYWHVRIGIDNRPLDNRILGIEYVLQNFTEEERVKLNKVTLEVCKKLATL